MQYKYETHVHSSQCSLCAVSSSQEMVQALHAAGYAGMVLTDHFIFGNTAVDRNLPWNQRMRCYYQSYLDAKEAAQGIDFDVIFGIEHAYGDGKEVLIYGVELDFLLANPDIPEITLDELVRRVHEQGGVVIQAHPYRSRSYVNMAVGPRIDIVDGIEIYNCGNLREDDLKAFVLSKHFDGIITCGGDIHNAGSEDVGMAGVVFPCRVSSSKAFAEQLRKREHQFIVGGKIMPEIKKSDLC